MLKSKKIIFAVFALWGMLAAAEEIKTDADFSGWKKTGKQISIDKNIKYSESHSVHLGDNSRISRTLSLEPNTEYEISCYMKGDRIQTTGTKGTEQPGARIMLNANQKWMRITGNQKNMPETGTFDWKKASGRFQTSYFNTGKITLHLTCVGTGNVWYDSLKIEKKNNTAGEPAFRKAYTNDIKKAMLIPKGTAGFFLPGETVKFKFEMDSRSPGVEYTLNVKDETGKQVFESPKKKFETEISIPGQPDGYYIVETNLFVNGKKAYYLQSAFAVNRPFVKRDPFFQFGFGVFPQLLEGYKRVGAGAISLKIYWRTSGKERSPEWLIQHNMDNHKVFLESNDFKLSACIVPYLNKNLRTEKELKEGWPLLNDKILAHILDVTGKYAEITKGKVSEWVIQQETPSSATIRNKYIGTWTESMASLVVISRMISRQVKKIDPNIKVMVGGNNIQAYTKDIERITLSDLVQDFDAYVIDAYTGNWNMVTGNHAIPEQNLMSFYQEASALSDSLGKGKIIKNEETGYAINYGAPFDRGLAVEQAYLTARTMIISKAAPVSSFELCTPALRWNVPEDNDSICMTTVWKPIQYQGKLYHIPLPGGAAYAAAAAQLSFSKFQTEVILGDIYSYIFTKADGSTLIALWNIAKTQPFQIELPIHAKAVNMYGRERKIAAGKQSLNIGPEPLYITLETTPEKVTQLMKNTIHLNSPQFKCAALPLSSNSVKIFVKSLVKTTEKCRLQLPGAQETTLRILPEKINTFTLPFQGDGTGILTASNGKKYEIPLNRNERFQVGRSAVKPVFDGHGEWRKGLRKGTLKYPDHIRPGEALQEERCYFKNSFNPNGHSISADYWSAYDDEYFYLAAEVDDPVHQQRHENSDIWRDDCLQFVFTTRDDIPETIRSIGDPIENSEFNYGVALTKNGTKYFKFLGRDKGVKDYPAKVTRRNGKTFYEIAIPFKALGGKPKGFGFVIFDNNNPAMKTAPYWLEFSPGIAGGADPARLKRLEFQ